MGKPHCEIETRNSQNISTNGITCYVTRYLIQQLHQHKGEWLHLYTGGNLSSWEDIDTSIKSLRNEIKYHSSSSCNTGKQFYKITNRLYCHFNVSNHFIM